MFYRHQRFDNYCSKCYNEIVDKPDNDKTEKMEISSPSPTSPSQPISIGKAKGFANMDLNVSSSLPIHSLSGNISQGSSPSSFQENSGLRKPRRVCAAPGCRKKLTLTSVECKCGETFCSSHRYAEQHNCPFDYKSSKQELLNKANPLVAPSKITEI